MRAVLHALRHRCGLHVSPREIASELDGPACVGTGDIIGIKFYLLVFGSENGVAPEQLAVIEAQPSLYFRVMLHNSLLLLLAHSALVQFSHEDGVAPLQHLSAVCRLPEFLSEAVRYAKQLLQLLARLLFCASAAPTAINDITTASISAHSNIPYPLFSLRIPNILFRFVFC